MPALSEPINKASDQSEKLYNLLSLFGARRYRLLLMKISFVIGLMGLGMIEIDKIISLKQLLLLSPLPAILFDIMIAAESFRITRIALFLENQGSDKYQKYVVENSDSFYKFASYGFTFLCIIVCYFVYFLYYYPTFNRSLLILSLISLLFLPIAIMLYENNKKNKLKDYFKRMLSTSSGGVSNK
jgi:hypothetical protein